MRFGHFRLPTLKVTKTRTIRMCLGPLGRSFEPRLDLLGSLLVTLGSLLVLVGHLWETFRL